MGSLFFNKPETSPKESLILKAPSISIINHFQYLNLSLTNFPKFLGKEVNF